MGGVVMELLLGQAQWLSDPCHYSEFVKQPVVTAAYNILITEF